MNYKDLQHKVEMLNLIANEKNKDINFVTKEIADLHALFTKTFKHHKIQLIPLVEKLNIILANKNLRFDVFREEFNRDIAELKTLSILSEKDSRSLSEGKEAIHQIEIEQRFSETRAKAEARMREIEMDDPELETLLEGAETLVSERYDKPLNELKKFTIAKHTSFLLLFILRFTLYTITLYVAYSLSNFIEKGFGEKGFFIEVIISVLFILPMENIFNWFKQKYFWFNVCKISTKFEETLRDLSDSEDAFIKTYEALKHFIERVKQTSVS
jgi:Fe2+ transport system protein B